MYYLTKTITVNNRTYYLLFDQNSNLFEKVYDFVNKYRNDLANLIREAIISAIKQLYEFSAITKTPINRLDHDDMFLMKTILQGYDPVSTFAGDFYLRY